MTGNSSTILIAGAGIAGLCAALCFAAKGYQVRVLERAARLEEFGAGLQISPNASRLLNRLGVLDRLAETAGRPQTLRIIDTVNGRRLAQMPLGSTAEMRWGAPYLVAHRADLQAALLDEARQAPNIKIVTGAEVTAVRKADGNTVADVTKAGEQQSHRCDLAIAADGVWSALRRQARSDGDSRFTGYVAWRALVGPNQLPVQQDAPRGDSISAYLSPDFHLVAYPVKGGKLVNLVAITGGSALAERWAIDADLGQLHATLRHSTLAALAGVDADWTAWPLHEVAGNGSWIGADGELVLIGDAAHAMTPFAAQGAAMAIEDAWVLAELVAETPGDIAGALSRFVRLRKPRVLRVARRAAFNRFTWHASGPVALVRNMVLRARSGAGLMADFDWLYGFDAAGRH